MGADYYESDAKRAKKLANGEVPLGVGENCVITNAIIDKNAGIGKVGYCCVCACVCLCFVCVNVRTCVCVV
jgi:hypothetical protein